MFLNSLAAAMATICPLAIASPISALANKQEMLIEETTAQR